MENNDVVIAENDIIPIDGAINSFKTHLQTHPRTILSAKFGDGKTFFLKEFTDKEEKEYLVLHLYPVNYQVCGNKDIFELVKYDILIQLLVKGVDLEIDEISDSILLSYYIQSNGLDLLANILKNINAISPNVESQVVSSCILGVRSIKKITEKFKEFKQQYTDEGQLLTFLSQKSVIYENDVITSIIKETIKKYRQEKKKKIVLVFDDMDRIEPAHLFRIMNVLSAHVDSYDDSIEKNKFGVDNIVLVLHYQNLVNIFHHFYGNNVDINGYVSKFMDKGYFEYSLNKQKNDYLYGLIQKATGMPVHLLKDLIGVDIIRNKSVRDIIASIKNIDEQIQDDVNNYETIPNLAFLRFFVVCRRLGLETYSSNSGTRFSLVLSFNEAFTKHPIEMIQLLATYIAPKTFYDQEFRVAIPDGRIYLISITEKIVHCQLTGANWPADNDIKDLYQQLMDKIAF